MRIIALALTILVFISCRSQDIGKEYSSYRVYKSFKKALKNKVSVEALDLSASGLNGLPENIGELGNLKVLILDRNEINSFPESFWALGKLEVLVISRNGLNSLPERIGELKSLRKIYASRNNLSSIPQSIVSLKNLVRLDLSFNKLADKDGDFVRRELPQCSVLIDVIL